jgi:aminopeptidase N
VVDPAKERFLGDVTIDVDVPAATPAIVLHGRDLSVIRADATVAGRPVSARAEARAAAGGKGSPEELVLTFTRPIPAGRAQIRVAYSAPLDGKLSGLYRVEEGGASYAFTQLEPMDARRLFPCFDEPGFKVPFDLKVTAPRGNLVVANANEIERNDADDGRSVTFTFATTPPLPTYLLALGVGPFEVREGDRCRSRSDHHGARRGEAPGARARAAAARPRSWQYFDRLHARQVDLLAVGVRFGAMENAGLITFREDLVLPTEGASVAARKMAENLASNAHHGSATSPWNGGTTSG